MKNSITENNTPVWNRYVLTIVEAAEYYHIGEKKLRSIVDEHPKADFIIMNGNRVLLKKKQFERCILCIEKQLNSLSGKGSRPCVNIVSIRSGLSIF